MRIVILVKLHIWQRKDANGGIVGIWGAMSDISRSFKPWEDGFSKGLYLAGVECVDNAEAPDGWTKWIIPDYEYIVVENHKGVFEETIGQMNEDGISLVGAVHDYTDRQQERAICTSR